MGNSQASSPVSENCAPKEHRRRRRRKSQQQQQQQKSPQSKSKLLLAAKGASSKGGESSKGAQTSKAPGDARYKAYAKRRYLSDSLSVNSGADEDIREALSSAGKRLATKTKSQQQQPTASKSSVPVTSKKQKAEDDEKLEPLDCLIGGNMGYVESVQKQPTVAVGAEKRYPSSFTATAIANTECGALPPLVKAPLGQHKRQAVASGASAHVLEADDDCDETRARVLDAADARDYDDAGDTNVDDEGAARPRRRLKSDSQQARGSKRLQEDATVIATSDHTTTIATTRAPPSPPPRMEPARAHNQIRGNGRDKGGVTAAAAAASPRVVAPRTPTGSLGGAGDRQPIKKKGAILRGSGPATGFGVVSPAVASDSAGQQQQQQTSPLTAPSRPRMMSSGGNMGNSIRHQTTSMSLSNSGGLAQRLNLVEDQRQRVRNWLESQPFTEEQSLIMLERWPRSEQEGDLTMLETTTTKTITTEEDDEPDNHGGEQLKKQEDDKDGGRGHQQRERPAPGDHDGGRTDLTTGVGGSGADAGKGSSISGSIEESGPAVRSSNRYHNVFREGCSSGDGSIRGRGNRDSEADETGIRPASEMRDSGGGQLEAEESGGAWRPALTLAGGSEPVGNVEDPQSSLGETVAPEIDEIVDEQCGDDVGCGDASSMQKSSCTNSSEPDCDGLVEQGRGEAALGGERCETAAAGAGSMQTMDFRKQASAEGDCSLCHYLASLKAVVGDAAGGGASESRGGPVCKHQIANKSGLRDIDILSVAEESLWSDIKLNRRELSECAELVKAPDGLVAGALMMMRKAGGVVEPADMAEPLDADDSDAARPSSAHSRLCPQDLVPTESDECSESAAADAQQHQRQKFISSPPPQNRPELAAPAPEDQDDDEVPATEPPLPAPRVRTAASSKASFVQRGLSLDANNGAGKQKYCGSSRRGQLKKMNSKLGLLNQRHKSQSSKLIVISSNSVSYTIQVASDNPLAHDDIGNQKYLNSKIRNKSTDTNILDKEYGEDDNENNRGLVDFKHNNKKETEFRSLSRIDSCKKFLVKKISGPNPRTARIKRKQVKHQARQQQTITLPLQTIGAHLIGGRSSNEIPGAGGEASQSISDNHQHHLMNKQANSMNASDKNQEGDMTPKADAQDLGSMSLSPEISIAERVARGSSGSAKPTAIISNSMESLGPKMNFEGAEAAVNESQFGEDTSRICNVAAKRLRELVAHLEHGSVPQSVLYQTLEYAASVLDSVTMDQISRVSDEEEGDLSEVQSDAVPNEVRKWLETTFTRNSISQKRKSEDKLKFRSVANAIRAGIVVDRIYRRMSASTPFVSAEVSNLLKHIDDWSFDCFSINQVSNGQVLKSVGYELFNRYGLMYKFKIPTTVLKNFLTQIESGYVKHKNPYHNNLHAADVTQTVHYMLWQAGLTNWLTDLEIFATLLAAIIHDYLHTGTTNNFHVMSQSDTALIYNDRAVLENFHICQAFTLMRNDDCNILAGLSKDEYREFRSLVIDMVLATDMSSHFQQIKAMKNILNHSDSFNADKSKILSLVIHISDISHPAKEWELHSKWTQFLMEEFFRQGDREKELNLECSPLCDRETTLVAESQLGFIEFIVSPSLEVCGDVLDRVLYQMAESNARPVLPASAKAASMVAASAGNQQAAIEAAPSTMEPSKREEQQQNRKTSQPQQQPQPQMRPPADRKQPDANRCGSALAATSAASSSPRGSVATSFVSSETLTSNLRKMIVSSSATIGRKLNISGNSSATSSTSSVAAASRQQVPAAPAGSARLEPATAAPSDFEQRQANYKHPVIQCDPSSRPKSSDARVRQQQRSSSSDTRSERDDNAISRGEMSLVSGNNSTEMATLDLAKQQSSNRLQQPAESGASKRTSSALATCGQTSRMASQTTLQSNKIQRPWIRCLDRNKKMWQERAVTDAHARELKERLKQQQQQIESADMTVPKQEAG